MNNSEYTQQCEFVAWFEKFHPDLRIFHIPNGGKRDIVTAIKMKKMGVKPGVPDLFIPSLKIFIEMKTEKGSLSKPQREWVDYLKSCGYICLICFGAVDAVQKIEVEIDKCNQTK